MDKIANLPGPLKWVLGVTGVGALIGVGGVAGSGNWKLLLLFALILVALLLIIVGGFILWNYLKRRKQNARLGSDINQSTTAAPRGMSATDLAKLDSMRKKFQEGVDAFRSRGKDLYALPWYAVVGEPGSGKTEAIRHCNVGFPPGMHEGDNSVGYMGAGGTINMNWWFTNHAVMLDTAGRLIFEEVKPGETSEWREFLKLLRKNRPNCPINGLLLVVPSDSLIKDSADQIAAKAGKIAQQLDVIQRVLDFRFPVYVIITKSDKINGFREFFEGLTDPQLQHQIMGWSNPEPLDTPFRPDAVDRHLSVVAERLRRRRLGLLRDPVPETAPRRTDEVDSLFVLPNSLAMLAPRLRSYLEKIFMPGEWSAKPLFLRGIYFTSSMREGAALDQELAEAIGVTADDLPEGKVWERDRAYFLRDLFIEKVFRERGLVTRATNVRARLQRNQILLYSCTLAALVIFITVAWFGMRTVRQSVGDRSAYWTAASKGGWTDGAWNYAVMKPDENTGNYAPVPGTVKFVDEKLTPGEVQEKIRELAADDLKGKWTTPGLAASYNNNSKESQRVIFETGVLEPIKTAVEKRMRDLKPESAEPNLPDTLLDLIKLESNILGRRAGEDIPLDTPEATSFLRPLWRFAEGTSQTPLDTNLAPVMVWTYTQNKYGVGAWPPSWLSATRETPAGTNNLVIAAALEYFIQQATNRISKDSTDWNQVSGVASALGSYSSAESAYVASFPDPGKMNSAFAPLNNAQDRLQARLDGVSGNTLLKNKLSLIAAFLSYSNNIFTYGQAAFDRVDMEISGAIRKRGKYPVFTQVAQRLNTQRRAFSSGLATLLSPDQLQEYKKLDDQYLAMKDGVPAWLQRWNMFKAVQKMSAVQGFPLLRASEKQMTPGDVTAAAGYLQTILAGANSEAMQQVTANNSADWKSLSNRMAELKPLADALKQSEKPNTCTIALLKMDTSAEDDWRKKYRFIKLSGDSNKINTNNRTDDSLGKNIINATCGFELYQTVDDTSPAKVITLPGQWGPVTLVGKYGAPATAGDYTTWNVKYPVEGSSGSLRLQIKFDVPLVDLDEWPKN